MEIKNQMEVEFKETRYRVHTIAGLMGNLTIHAEAVGKVEQPAPKRKPFDLEAAKAGAKLVTRDGAEALNFAHFPAANTKENIIAVVRGDIRHYCANGKYLPDGKEHGLDLFLVAETKTRYFNLYPKNGGHGVYLACDYETAEAAREGADHDAIAVAVPVEIDA